MAKEYLSPGVGYTETEEILSASSPVEPIIVVVGGAVKGDTAITKVTSRRQLKSQFGVCAANDLGVFAADYLLGERCTVLYKRVMGEDAAVGTAGESGNGTDLFTFKTRQCDSTLNGATISLTYDTEKGTVDMVLKSGTKEIEVYRKLSYRKGESKYLPDILESQGSVLVAKEETGVASPENVVLTIRGANDGIASLKPETYAAVVSEFENTETLNFSMIIVPGQSDEKVVSPYASLARERGDCMYFPDMPFGTTPSSAIAWVNSVDNSTLSYKLDNQWVEVMGPWVKVKDATRNTYVWAPPSVISARVKAQSDRITNGCWIAAAGFSDGRGLVPDAVEVEYILTKDDRDLWQGNGGVLNPIAYFEGKGIVVFGNKTTRRTPDFQEESVYCNTHIRRLANYVKRLIIDVALSEIFNPNDPLTWASFKAKLNPKLKAIKDSRGLQDYKIVMDETTVSEEDIRNGQAPGIVYIKPLRAIEFIPITFAMTENSAIFTDEEEEE